MRTRPIRDIRSRDGRAVIVVCAVFDLDQDLRSFAAKTER